MKILNLRFQNLNSLCGEWSIDFTSPEYVGNGIFAITGPTGSGKSTILDAICLALYGRTPRLKAINQSHNDIMARQTGECFAEVVFETASGQFKCHWSQHRARKKVDGKLAPAKHEISDAVTGAVLGTKKSEVADLVETRTGMDFDRFSRSMLLAQGGFDAFLQAGANDRAPILEQITGTEIYSDISKRVHEQYRQEADKLTSLEDKQSGIKTLNAEEVAELEQEIVSRQKAETVLARADQVMIQAIAWLEGIATLEKELAELQMDSTRLSLDLQKFAPERLRLQQALKAAELDGVYASLTAMRQEQEKDQQRMAEAEKNLPDFEKAVREKRSLFHAAEQQVSQARTLQKTEAELIVKTRRLDVFIGEKKAALQTVDIKLAEGQTFLAEKKEEQQKFLGAQQSANAELLKITAYLSDNESDAALVAEYSGLVEQFKKLEDEEQKVAATTKQCADANKQMEAQFVALRRQEKEWAETKKGIEVAKIAVAQVKKKLAETLSGRLLREYRQEHEGLIRERGYLREIASLEEKRNKLADKTPCPLCGSLDHPFALGNIPTVDKIDLQISRLADRINKVEELESEVKTLQKVEQGKDEDFRQAKEQLQSAIQGKDNTKAEQQRLQGERQQLADHLEKSRLATLIRIQPYGVTALPADGFESVLASLQRRRKAWQETLRRKEDVLKGQGDVASQLAGLVGNIQMLCDAEKKDLAERETMQEQLAVLLADRRGLYGEKDPDVEELRLAVLLTDLEKKEQEARTEKEEASQRCNDIKTIIAAKKDAITARQPELAEQESAFGENCLHVGCVDEFVYLSQKLSMEERNSLGQEVKDLDDQQTRLVSRQKDRQEQLTLESAKKLTLLSLDDLRLEQRETGEKLRESVEELGRCKQRISEHKAAGNEYKQQQGLIDKQHIECRKIGGLHALIGSADGKKFRNFAQGLTFELMVSHANKQLIKMSDRYLLVRDDMQPLELNVVDNYQAGEIRSTKNLSGGEGFIVSLSLALGLSKMASRKVRVDSLFLDEGFGTLDEDALETALECLSGLQEDGKLIGVISHVPALKERISTQINIQPAADGRSRIIGPGCVGQENK